MNPISAHHYFLVSMTALAMVGNFAHANEAKTQSSRPNIVFLLADDLGWRDLGCMGHESYRTPHIDRLRAEGMLFTRAYAAAPICSASRASLLTGDTPARLHYEFVPKFAAGPFNGDHPLQPPPFPTELPAGKETIATQLKKVGYQTAFFGKWHLNRHYQHYLGWRPGSGPESFGFDHCVEDFGSHPYSYGKNSPPTPVLGNGFPDDTLTSAAADFIKAKHDKPFLLWMAFFYVHDPFSSRCLERVAYHQKRLPANASPARAHYAAMVETLDEQVGRLLAALDESGQASNTIVIFTSDNGGNPLVSANGPLRGSKWTLYEGGVRAPLIARWPNHIQPKSSCQTPVIGYDIAPTLAEVAAAGRFPGKDGSSFFRLFKDPNATLERSQPFVWHFPYYQPETHFEKALPRIGVNDFAVPQSKPHAALLDGERKYIHDFETNKDELYDLKADASESRNLAADDPVTVITMRKKLFQMLADQSARLPTTR